MFGFENTHCCLSVLCGSKRGKDQLGSSCRPDKAVFATFWRLACFYPFTICSLLLLAHNSPFLHTFLFLSLSILSPLSQLSALFFRSVFCFTPHLLLFVTRIAAFIHVNSQYVSIYFCNMSLYFSFLLLSHSCPSALRCFKVFWTGWNLEWLFACWYHVVRLNLHMLVCGFLWMLESYCKPEVLNKVFNREH